MDRISKLKEYLKSSENDSFLQHALALEYIKAGNDEDAEKLFREILEREPSYIGSYYHLGKLLERNGKESEAIFVYKNGMEKSKTLNDTHSYNELRASLENLEDSL